MIQITSMSHPTKAKIITRNVWVLSIVSMFTDVASEMLYPIMPVYLKSIGFSIIVIGILEGVAEAVAGLSKGYFGKLSDAKARRVPFVQIGYALSAISKPMMAVFMHPLWIFFARSTDRLGKGIRTGARDALLSDEATPATKARVFGFHRALDTLGAVLGPVLALFYLHYNPGAYATMFILAFFPGLLAIVFTLLIRETKRVKTESVSKPGFWSFLRYWPESPAQYRQLVGALLVFTLFNSSDVFLLLKIKDAGQTDTTVIGIYIFYNLVYALAAYPMGILADKFGMKRVFVAGMFLFAAVYAGMAFAEGWIAFAGLFFLYGVYAAATEGVAKAWITNLSDKAHTATAIGTYTAFQSICTMLASTFAGIIWYNFGAGWMFGLSACVAVVVALFISRFKYQRPV